MQDRLLIFKLKIKSSYLQNKELPSDTDFDTLQFYAHGDTVWRIKTYAVDSDIHIHQINPRGKSLQETLIFLTESTKAHYGDVMDQEYEMKLAGPDDMDTASAFLKKHTLSGKLESHEDYALWNPNGAIYTTQSRPM